MWSVRGKKAGLDMVEDRSQQWQRGADYADVDFDDRPHFGRWSDIRKVDRLAVDNPHERNQSQGRSNTATVR